LGEARAGEALARGRGVFSFLALWAVAACGAGSGLPDPPPAGAPDAPGPSSLPDDAGERHPGIPPAGLSGDDAGVLSIHFLDVGQGDAALIEAPGGRWILVDAGPGAGVVEHLRRLEVDTIDLFVASHNHADHIGGAAETVRGFPVRYFMDNGVPHTTLTYGRMLDALVERDVTLLEPERRTVTLGEVSLEILPPPGDPELGHNDNSVGMILRFGDFRASFAGDAEARLWHHWLEHFDGGLVPVEVHKASHHGSRNGDILAALERLRPALVVVSAGPGNAYGHPHPEALALYCALGATVVVTSDHGSITVRARRDGSFEIDMERGEAGREASACAGRELPASGAGTLGRQGLELQHGPPVPGGDGGAHETVEEARRNAGVPDPAVVPDPEGATRQLHPLAIRRPLP
jgi:competence protein ComEC